MALSYVWGGVHALETTTTNFSSLLELHGLDNHESLAPVVRDACKLVASIGERFLWADCLCIIQNSSKKHQAIAQMDIIYSHATATVIAVDGKSAKSGLPGVNPSSRLPLTRTERIAGQNMISEPPFLLNSVVEGSVYETRAWTLQERCLSKRLLFISDQQVYFQCNQWLRSEYKDDKRNLRDINNDLERPSGISTEATSGICFRLSGTPHPDVVLQIYQNLVQTYSTRRLTYDSDVLNAFSGFTSIFEELYKAPCVCGLPIASLNASLLWTGVSRLKRRRLSEHGFPLPSWSWAGWIGPVRYPKILRPRVAFSEIRNTSLHFPGATNTTDKWPRSTQFSDQSVMISLKRAYVPSIRRWEIVKREYLPIAMQSEPSCSTLPASRFAVSLRALCAELDQFTVQKMTRPVNGFHLCSLTRPTDEKPCGVLFESTELNEYMDEGYGSGGDEEQRITKNPHLLVLLSTETNHEIMVELRTTYGVGLRPGKDCKIPTNHTFNVMVVRDVGNGSFERCAVGKMLPHGWPERARKRAIVLV
jgi:hypothetical protein